MSDLSALQVALRGLGVDLRTELERYRRARHASGLVPTAPSLPDDYLASSEQLLQHIATNDSMGAAPEKKRRRVSPLFLVGIAMVVGAIGLLVRGLQRQPTQLIAGPSAPLTSADEPAPPTPNLTQSADLSLGLAALPHVEPDVEVRDNSSPLPDRPERSAPAAAPAEEIVAAAPDLEADFFYVTLDYSQTNLLQVRQWIPDAFVVKFPAGNRIQAGAFYRRDQAERAAAQLQQHDLAAAVYRPE